MSSNGKRFFLNDKINKGLSEAVTLAENYTSQYENKPLTITRIIPDETNPRDLAVQFRQIKDACNTVTPAGFTGEDRIDKIIALIIRRFSEDLVGDEVVEKVTSELESLKELAMGIEKNGLLNPITVYKEGESYIIVAGERRFLAHLLLGKKFVEARVFSERPSGLNKKLVQWLENVQREDLSLYAKVENVRHIAMAYKDAEGEEITPTILSKLSGVHRTSASRYLLLANSPSDVLLALKEDKLQNILKAVTVASEPDVAKRAALIADAGEGASIDWIKQQKKAKTTQNTKQKGRANTKVQFGATKKQEVAKKVILAVVEQYKLDYLKKKTAQLNWDSYKDITVFFAEVLKELEGKK